jgi:hypothetical protein
MRIQFCWGKLLGSRLGKFRSDSSIKVVIFLWLELFEDWIQWWSLVLSLLKPLGSVAKVS